MNHKIPIEQLLRWRLAHAEAEAPPAPRAARLLALTKPWWETLPEQFDAVVEQLGRIQFSYGLAMAEPHPSHGGHPIPAVMLRQGEKLETSVRALYLSVREGRLRLRFHLDAPERPPAEGFEVTFVAHDLKPLFATTATLSVDSEYRIDAEIASDLARDWAPLRVTDRMPFRLIIRLDKDSD